ncbi:hypothetical protein L9F63_006346 [Diploptera punctata]|uniref:Uncharacterized protein n=1 Tax=Diploptera punctata TaxID=6984 RepID=A0AAD7ZB64_DIPPU|nr:hypothetical protein L9F63_006346 [Diploptera punctata]
MLATDEKTERTPPITAISANGTAPGNSTIKSMETNQFMSYKNYTTKGIYRKSKNILDWTTFFSGSDSDPYLTRVNIGCLSGDLSDCFKLKALTSLDEFFDRDAYPLSDTARMVRMPKHHLRQLNKEPFEFSSTPRADEPEWDQFVKFLMRKVERFVKSTAIEVQFSNEVTNGGRYAPRFIDEIATEIDIIEDKNESTFSRTNLKKLFIPLLIILKLFKLKLLLFLPLILGLASFKKLLGFLALVVPGLIGFFQLCKPDLHHNYGSYGHSSFYHQPPHYKHKYTPTGVAAGHHHFSNEAASSYDNPYSRISQNQPFSSMKEQQSFPISQESSSATGYSNPTGTYDSEQLAYQGYQHFKKR